MPSQHRKRKQLDGGASTSKAQKTSKKKKKSEDPSEDVGEEQQVDFDFCDPEESDFHIVKSLVQKLLDGEDLDSSALADLMIDEAQVSSVIRCGEDCVGIAALLPLSVFREQDSVQQILKFLRKKAKSASNDVQQQLEAAIQATKTSLLVSERVLNAPPELATPLMAGLVAEAKHLTAEEDVSLHPHGKFDQVLHCATAYVDSGAGAHDLGAVPVTGAAATGGAEGEVVFVRPEDEFLHSHAKWSLQWDVPEGGRYSQHSKRVRVLMAVPKKGLRNAVQQMAAMFHHDLSAHGL